MQQPTFTQTCAHVKNLVTAAKDSANDAVFEELWNKETRAQQLHRHHGKYEETLPHVEGATGDLYSALVGVAHVRGHGVRLADMTPACGGVFNMENGGITLNRNRAPSQRVPALLHELAHTILHPKPILQSQWAQAEFEAEATAHTLCQLLGVKSSYSAYYIAAVVHRGHVDVDRALENIHKAVTLLASDLAGRVAEPQAA